jgi:hypothetical protein
VPSGRIVGRSTTGTGRAELLTAEQLRELCSLVDTAESLDQEFTETITWTGTTAPSGTATNRYSWVRVGKLVYFCFRFQWSGAGSGLVTAEWPMPAAMPQPAGETGADNNEVITMQLCGVAFTLLQTINHAMAAEARIARDSSGNVRFRARFGTTAVMTLIFNGVYRCA